MLGSCYMVMITDMAMAFRRWARTSMLLGWREGRLLSKNGYTGRVCR